MPIWIKICANTSAADAIHAIRLGADAVGFVFAPSTRRVTPAQVRAISFSLPDDTERVGVFPTATVDEIAEAAIEARLHGVQLHGGDVTPAYVEALAQRLGESISIIQTLHWSAEPIPDDPAAVAASLAALAEARPANSRILVDAKVGASASGGTGHTFDWTAARTVLSSQPGLRIIVAGGLNPGNVAHAIRTLNPWGVDVASGVESVPGLKDLQKLQAFMENARGA